MMAVVEPDILNSEYDLQLTSGATVIPLRMCDSRGNRSALAFTRDPVRRSSLKMYSDQQKYSDLEPPWTPISQTDWSGGRGSKDFDKDASMYYDGYQVNTIRPGEIILGPKPTTASFGSAYDEMTNTEDPARTSAKVVNLTDAGANTTFYYAHYIYTTEAIDVKDITVKLARITSNITGTLSIGLAANNSGVPDTVTYATTTYAASSISSSASAFKFTFASPYALSDATVYWIVFKVTGMTAYSQPSIWARESTTNYSGSTYHKYSANGSSWSNGTGSYAPWFLMTNGGIARNKAHMFEYKGALYYILQNDDQTNSKLLLNGDHGLATGSETGTTITFKGNINWSANSHNNSILKIVTGAGASQPQPWRYIVDTALSGGAGPFTTELTIDSAFDVAPAANDVLAIVASDQWTEIAEFDTNYSAFITSVLPVNGVVYCACGDSADLIRWYAYNSAGTWTYDWSIHAASSYAGGSVSESTTAGDEFTYLGYMSDETGTYVVGARGGYPSYIKKAEAIDGTAWAGSGESALSWGDAINIGDLGERITGLETYGEYGSLHILKEGSIHYLYDGMPYQINIREMESTKDYRNGIAHCVKGVYLYISWHNTVLRYYNGMLDTIGPDRAEVAVPTENKQGNFSALVSYPGLLIGAIDTDYEDGVSSVLAYNDFGWCELYQGSTGERIQNLYVQSIPGNAVDRLWISEGNRIVWLPLSTDPYNHPADDYQPYNFCSAGYLITSWYYLGLQDIDKLYNSIKLVAETCDAGYAITAAYQTDDDTTWTDITGTYDSFSEELDLAATPSVTGKRIRFKITLTSDDGLGTPRILASVMDTITRLPNKYITTVTVDLGIDDTYDYASSLLKFNALTAFQNLATPVTVESRVDMLDNMTAFVDGLTPRIIELRDTNEKPRYLAQFSLIEI